jgi:type I restriction enzyme S subunit
VIPPGWKEAHIGDVVTDLKSGLSRKLSSSDIGLPVIRSTNITDQGLLDLSDIKYWYREDPQGASTENYFLQAGDILVNFINSVAQIGKCALYQGELNRDTIYTTNIFCVRVHDRILPEYFLLLSRTREYAHYIHSITKPAVNQASFTTKDFKRFHFALPPLSEQRKIAEILDTWDQAIALTERRIEAARQRKKGLMQRLLTGRVRFPEFAGEEWQRVTLGQVSRFIRNGFSSRQNKLGKGYPVTRIETISNGSVNLNAVGYTEARIEQLEKYCLRKGDILFSHINSLKHIAKAAIFDGAEELYHGMNLLAIRRERYTFGT